MFRDLFSIHGPYARFMNFLWNMIVLSVLWFVCCIPVVTIGASSLAAYYAAAKCVRHHTGNVVSEFFSAFRLNFRQATFFSVLYEIVLVFLVIDCIYLYSDTSVPMIVLYLFYFLILITVANAIYLFSCMSRFAMPSRKLFRLSMALLPRRFLSTILLLLLLVTIVLAIYVMPWSILILPGVGFWLRTFLVEPILLSLSPKPQPGSEEAQKWYYQ